jgi:F-type H+-transporting ATPase subunit delta
VSHEAVARRYARAVFDLGKETGDVETLAKEVAEIAATYSANAELEGVLDNPLVPTGEREGLLVDLATRMGLSETTRSTLRLLARKRRLLVLPELSRQLRRLADEDAGLLRADVTSAHPLSPAYLEKLKGELEKATGKKIAIVPREDPTLIAGVVTRVGDQVIDGSVHARLQGFRDALLRA